MFGLKLNKYEQFSHPLEVVVRTWWRDTSSTKCKFKDNLLIKEKG